MEIAFWIALSFIGSALVFKLGLKLFKDAFYRRLLERRVSSLEEKYNEPKTPFEKSDFFDQIIDARRKTMADQTASTYSYVVQPEKSKPLIDPNVLMFMIKSCHPDRFATDKEDEVLAKQATDWLLNQRKKQKKEGFNG